MILPGKLDLTALRWVPFSYDLDFPGYDFTGAIFAMHVRQYRDAPGAPLLSLLGGAAPLQDGISVPEVAVVNGITTSTVRIYIKQETLWAILPFPASGLKAGDDVRLVYDLQVAGGGLPKSRIIEGAFIIHPGATQ